MNCVTHVEAEAFCRQAGGRLPTELEWEYAARGRVGGRYPWGNTPSTATCTEAVIRETMAGCGTGGPLPVGSRERDASPWGVRDMAGNLREWTSTWARSTERLGPPTDNTHKIVRGGDWNTSGNTAQSFRRSFHPFDGYDARTGFRCVY